VIAIEHSLAGSGAQYLAATGAATGQNLTTGFGGHTRTKPVTTGANNATGLKGTFHGLGLWKGTCFEPRFLGVHLDEVKRLHAFLPKVLYPKCRLGLRR
jgi:hypothetical protein